MLPAGSRPSPVIDDTCVTFVLADIHHRLKGVRLLQEIGLPDPLGMVHADGRWQLRIPLPDVDRMEYLYEIEDHNGFRSTITDPANRHWVGGAFGDKSEVRFGRYQEPEWLTSEGVEHCEHPWALSAGPLGLDLTGTLWSPTALAPGQPAPLVVVHDGPEYAALGSLGRYLSSAIGSGILPPLRAVLLAPGDRNVWYSASSSYARTLRKALLSALPRTAPATVRIGVGVSLGGLAMLHAHRSYPELFDALLLQSASFFTPTLDPQERTFSGFDAITGFVAEVHSSDSDEHPIPSVLTCGVAEENLANNRRMATTLCRLGYAARLVELRDAHNYTAWRDGLHPHFTTLVGDLVGHGAA